MNAQTISEAKSSPALPVRRIPAWTMTIPLVVLVVVAFLPVLDNGFVNLDDDANFLYNPHYRGLGRAQLAWAWTTDWLGVFQPLAWMLFEAQYAVFGLNPRGYHLTSLLLHALTAVALFSLTRALVGRARPDLLTTTPTRVVLGSALAVALIMVHPLRVEVVAWASCQPYLPCTALAVLATRAYLGAVDASPPGRAAGLAGAWLLFAMALLFKAAAVALPAILLLIDVYPLRRLGGSSRGCLGPSARRVFAEKLSFFALSLIFAALAVWAKGSNQSLVALEQRGLPSRIAQACYGACFYLVKTFWPTGLCAYYPAPDPLDWRAPTYLACMALVTAASVAVYLLRRRHLGWLATWLAYLAILAPTSGLVTIGRQIVADRYSYLATLSALPLLTATVVHLTSRGQGRAPVTLCVTVAGLGLVAALAVFSRAQCRTWRDTVSLASHALNHGGRDPEIYLGLGWGLEQRGDLAGADASFCEALRLEPFHAPAMVMLGMVRLRQGQGANATALLTEAVRLQPNVPETHNNLGTALSAQGRLDEAIAQFTEALRLRPGFAEARSNLARAKLPAPDRGRDETGPDDDSRWGHRGCRRSWRPLERRRPLADSDRFRDDEAGTSRVLARVLLELTDGMRWPAHTGSIGSMSKNRRRLGSWSCLGLVLLVLAVGIGWHHARVRTWRVELVHAREAMNAGRTAWRGSSSPDWRSAGPPTAKCSCSWASASCCRASVRRPWPPGPKCLSHPHPSRAARYRASNLIHTGRYSTAEVTLLQALSNPGQSGTSDLERELNQLYRFEGRFDDMRRVLRGSWWRSADPAGVLKELWMLDHSTIPIEAWQLALDKTDNDDDRVWLGRAHHAILVGRFRDASKWLERCLRRRPDDPAIWRARLDLALATDDVAGFWSAVAHVPADRFDTTGIHGLRAWLAARRGETAVERRELTAQLRDDPGNAQALERLAVLTSLAGQAREAEQLRCRKAEIDRVQHQFNKILLDGPVNASRAEVLAGLAVVLGRTFDAQGWAILAEAKIPVSNPARDHLSQSESRSPLPAGLVAKALALSSPFPILLERGSGNRPALSVRFADLRATATERRDTLAETEATRPGDPRSTPPEFADDAAAVGLRFSFHNGQTPQRLLPETMSGGVGLLDFDGDGWLDVYCVQGGADQLAGLVDRRRPGDRLFRNRGDGTFQDVTVRIRHRRDRLGTRLRTGSRRRRLRQRRASRPVRDPVADLRALSQPRRWDLRGRHRSARAWPAHATHPTSAAFADLDNDGDLDLYVCHYMIWDPANPLTCHDKKGESFYCDPRKVEPAPDHVFRNEGGRFVDVTASAGFVEADGRGLGVVAADLDGDHRIDLYVANDGTANYLFRNQGGFHFEEVGHLAGVAGSAAGGIPGGHGGGLRRPRRRRPARPDGHEFLRRRDHVLPEPGRGAVRRPERGLRHRARNPIPPGLRHRLRRRQQRRSARSHDHQRPCQRPSAPLSVRHAQPALRGSADGRLCRHLAPGR